MPTGPHFSLVWRDRLALPSIFGVQARDAENALSLCVRRERPECGGEKGAVRSE